MTGVEIAMAAVAVAGTAVSIQGAKNQGKVAAAAAEREAAEKREEAELAKLRASQSQALLLEEANRADATRMAQAAALHFDPTISGSFRALQSDADRQTARSLRNEELHGMLGERRSLLAADNAQFKGKTAKDAANLTAFGRALGGAGKILGQSQNWGGSSGSPDGTSDAHTTEYNF